MIYNHYIPGSNGVYKKEVISQSQQKEDNDHHDHSFVEACQTAVKPNTCISHQKQPAASGLDLGDLLLLCIVLLLLLDADRDDVFGPMIAAAAFILLR